MAAAGFSDLPTEALDEIARRVGPLDNVTCSAVCRPWRRALKTARLRLLTEPSRPRRLCLDHDPWPLTSWDMSKEERECWTKVCLRHESGERSGAVCAVLDCKDGLPRPTRVIGCSCYGWVIAVDKACGLSLLDPLTGRRFRLPPPPVTASPSRGKNKARSDHDHMLQGTAHRKAALVPGRRLGTYAVMLIHGGGHALSFLPPGAKSWTTLRAPAWAPKKYLDVIFHKGAFYTVSADSELNAWVPDGGATATGLRARRVTEPRQERLWAVLVESTARNELLMVSTPDISATLRKAQPYEVSRYDEREGRWIPVTNHGSTTIFVGERSSLCVPRRGCSSSSSLRTPMAMESSWDGYIIYSFDSGYGSWFLPYVAPEFPHY